MSNMFLRNDTIFGVCEALGEDFGFNPNYLRVALILPIFWFPTEVAITYAALGLVVLASRFLFKDNKVAVEQAEASAPLVTADPANQPDGAIAEAA